MAEIKLTTTRWELEKARFFFEHAKESLRLSPWDTKAFRYFVEATIVFGRSVIEWVKREASKNKAIKGVFKKWFEEWYSMLEQDDPLFNFLNEARNIIIHERPIPLLHQLRATFAAKSSMTGYLTITHKLPDGTKYTERVKIGTPQKSRSNPRRVTKESETASSSEEIFFKDPKTNNTYPVLSSLEQYLNKLEEIIVTCEEYLNEKLGVGESRETQRKS